MQWYYQTRQANSRCCFIECVYQVITSFLLFTPTLSFLFSVGFSQVWGIVIKSFWSFWDSFFTFFIHNPSLVLTGHMNQTDTRHYNSFFFFFLCLSQKVLDIIFGINIWIYLDHMYDLYLAFHLLFNKKHIYHFWEMIYLMLFSFPSGKLGID